MEKKTGASLSDCLIKTSNVMLESVFLEELNGQSLQTLSEIGLPKVSEINPSAPPDAWPHRAWSSHPQSCVGLSERTLCGREVRAKSGSRRRSSSLIREMLYSAVNGEACVSKWRVNAGCACCRQLMRAAGANHQ